MSPRRWKLVTNPRGGSKVPGSLLASSLLLFTSQALGQEIIDAIASLPVEVGGSIGLGLGVRSQANFEFLGQVALGSDVRQEVREVRKGGLLGADQALQRDDIGGGARHFHWSNCGHIFWEEVKVSS